ncbi:MAG: DUF1810 domain-containing protein [Prevotella sp.]|nr:DUF1810 domain-containing protein [Alistipes senegalensis]MCM1357392.1 DUF1810 domain-containing protein [Prevotella sp.]MCM1473115.1 DUF1810 domain-containing protein [Muribaculaceae bacterium]
MERFLIAQESSYPIALDEIKNGKKRSHWIWYIFPQLAELGRSSMAKYYGIKDIDEARKYLENDILRERLVEISNALLLVDDTAVNILGHIDALKVKSCMTLFHMASPENKVFSRVIDKFYGGKYDNITIDIINKREK